MERLQGVTSVQPYRLLFLALLALPALAQNTCYTNPQGTTICSNSGSVIHGNTNSAGNSVYRDDRGNRLDFPPQDRDGPPMNASQKTTVTPFFFVFVLGAG